MNVKCEHCSAKHFNSEKVANKDNSFNDCCNHGSVELNPLTQPPYELYELFNGNHPKSKHFYGRIRGYNNTFSFASFNAKTSNFDTQRRGPYCFKIQGQIYYQINTALYPTPNETPSYGQLFIVDNNEATECRLHRNSNLNEEMLHLIDKLMRKNNIFAQSYRMMHEEIQMQQLTENYNMRDLQLGFLTKKGIDRYNIQKVNEVAAVFYTTADGEIPETYVTIYNKRNKTLQQVSTMDPNVEPWIYPLFYPYGNQDNYIKIEKDRINYCKQNQKQLRIESYQGLIDYLANAANNDNAHVGKMIILPSTFVGSPRNMLQHYQDAMTIVRRYGKPDIFITMTCNPICREIKENLFPNQQPADGPDICAHEIQEFIEARYVGPVEACWRILSKSLQEKSHTIFRLPIHLPNKHSVIIDDNINNDAIRFAVERAKNFQELRTVNNEIHQTFTAACLALGLIEDDNEWSRNE
ncbi:PREDICTED: uncharacterized protein LOC108759082 [Trachymyrmex cornetzi]|uniref:uncharacterized protein LOC108759082 n=1 Tax=Trachymyrmex cornetzi TaxID=471704 RepID=UPI00084F0E95|nr:PREDICTED: uncharacterized protein LOC108759082 [Trachymyrmex cornetzi]